MLKINKTLNQPCVYIQVQKDNLFLMQCHVTFPKVDQLKILNHASKVN